MKKTLISVLTVLIFSLSTALVYAEPWEENASDAASSSSADPQGSVTAGNEVASVAVASATTKETVEKKEAKETKAPKAAKAKKETKRKKEKKEKKVKKETKEKKQKKQKKVKPVPGQAKKAIPAAANETQAASLGQY